MGPDDFCTRFMMIRHARTAWNDEGRIQGRLDIPLSGEGRKDAGRWAETLSGRSVARILTSPLKRTFETSCIISEYLKVEIEIESDLREQDMGRWEGKTLDELKTEAEVMMSQIGGDGWKFCPPGGEDRISLLNRTESALIRSAKKWPNENILTVTHHGVIKFLIYHLMGRKLVSGEPRLLDSRCMHTVDFGDGRLKVSEINAPLSGSIIL